MPDLIRVMERKASMFNKTVISDKKTKREEMDEYLQKTLECYQGLSTFSNSDKSSIPIKP